MTNGVLNVKHRKPEESKEKSQKKRQPAYRTYVKGRNYMPKQVRWSEEMYLEALKVFFFVFVFFLVCAKLKGGKTQRHTSLSIAVCLHYISMQIHCVCLILNLYFNSRRISLSVSLENVFWGNTTSYWRAFSHPRPLMQYWR